MNYNTCAISGTSGTDLTIILQKLRKFLSRVIVDSEYVIRFSTSIIFLMISGVQYVINSLINYNFIEKKIQRFSPKLMLTRYIYLHS